MSNFVKGMAKLGGRKPGVKNRLSHKFLEDLEAEWQEGGRIALKICRIEKPIEFAKLVAGLLPREFSIEDSRLKDLDDQELEVLINEMRAKLKTAIVREAEQPTIN